MRLYYSPGACSLAAHIVLAELHLPYELEKIDLGSIDNSGFKKINPKGYVPALQLDDGSILTENIAILTYLGERNGSRQLIPTQGMARYRALEWLSFIATELHRSFGALWVPETPENIKQRSLEQLFSRFGIVSQHLSSTPYLFGEHFSVGDAYLFTVLNWSSYLKIDLTPWSPIKHYHSTISRRPTVQQAMKEEGLL